MRSAEALTRPGEAAFQGARGPFSALVIYFDEWLRRQAGVVEYSNSPGCMLRVQRRRAESDIMLSGGVVVAKGDPILDLHFWNERIPQTAATQGLGWGGRFGRGLIRSFSELAVAIERDPRINDAVAVRGRLAFAAARNRDETRRFAHWFGMETPAQEPRRTARRCLYEAGEDIWQLALSYAFNPGCLPARQIARRRDDLWLSKAALLARYGGRRESAP